MLVWKTQHGHNWRPYLITSHQKETHLNIITTTPKSKTEKVPHRFILHIYPRSNSHRKSGKKINWNQWTLNIYTAPFTPHHQSCPIFNIPCTRMAPWQSCLKKKKKNHRGHSGVCNKLSVPAPCVHTHTCWSPTMLPPWPPKAKWILLPGSLQHILQLTSHILPQGVPGATSSLPPVHLSLHTHTVLSPKHQTKACCQNWWTNTQLGGKIRWKWLWYWLCEGYKPTKQSQCLSTRLPGKISLALNWLTNLPPLANDTTHSI